METALGAYDIAEPMFRQAVEMMQQVGDYGRRRAMRCACWHGARCAVRGDYAQATAWFEQALAMYQQVGNLRGIALAYSGLGEIAVRQGELEQSRASAGTKPAHKPVVRGKVGMLPRHWVARRGRRCFRAILSVRTALLGESLLMRKDIGDPGGMAWCLEKLAEIAHLQADNGRAALIFGAAAALRASFNSTIDQPTDQNMIA